MITLSMKSDKFTYTVDSRYLDFGYPEQPLISKRKSDPCYAPNFGEVAGAYWFGPVRPSVRLSVRNTWQLRNPKTAYARILKFYMWRVHEK